MGSQPISFWKTSFPNGRSQRLYNIGEHVYKLSSELKSGYPELPWNMVAGLRHRLVHDYEGINWSIIVQVVFEEMPGFVDRIRQIYDETEA